jgi:hypothetical protein
VSDDDQLKKFILTDAVFSSGMLTSDRMLMMIFIDKAELYGDGTFWFIPEHRTPSLTELTTWSGLGRSTVGKRLNHLEGTGWLKRSRPATADALGRHERTVYWLAIGETEERAKPKRPGRGRYAEPGAAAGLVQPLHEGEQTKEAETLVQPLHDPSAAAAPDPVQPLHDPSAAAAHNNQPPTGVGFTQGSQQDPPAHAAAAAAATPPLPGFETTEQTPAPKPKRKGAAKKPAAEPKPPTEGQRINKLARSYTDVVKPSTFHGVRAAVQAMVRCGEYSDEQIAAALEHLALPENRNRLAVSTNTLRIAVDKTSGKGRTNTGTRAWRGPADPDSYYAEED